MLGIEFLCNIEGLQYTELAEKIGAHKQSISAWANGRVNIPKKFTPELVKIFGVDSKYFQKPLTEVDKIEIQQQLLNREIRNSIEYYEDEIIDEETGDRVTVIRDVVDPDLIEQSQILSLQKEQLGALERINLSLSEVQKYASNATEQVYKTKEILDLYDDLSKLVTSPTISPNLIKSLFIALGEVYGVNLGLDTNRLLSKDLAQVLEKHKYRKKDTI